MILDKHSAVQHVCYIMDGDRTFAILENVPKADIDHFAYHSGAMALENLMKMAFDELGIKCLSVNLIGRRNCLSRRESTAKIVSLVPKFFGKKWIDYFVRKGVRVKFLGDIDLFCSLAEDPSAIKDEILRIETLTSKFHNFHLFPMAAYEPSFEYMKLANEGRLTSPEEAKLAHYGTDVPDVDLIIRSWRPKFSGCVPILTSDYSDIYFFPAPFQCFRLKHFKAIVADYEARNKTVIRYNQDDMEVIREHGAEIRNGTPVIIGRKVGKIWLPIQ